MALTKEEVLKIAKLSKLSFEEKEIYWYVKRSWYIKGSALSLYKWSC